MDRERKIVSRGAGFELIDKPEPLLRKREWQRIGTRARLDLNGLCRRRWKLGINERGEPRNRRRLKQAAQRNFDIQRCAHAREDLRGAQRMTAEPEKVVVDSDLLDAEHLGPDAGQNLFDARAG